MRTFEGLHVLHYVWVVEHKTQSKEGELIAYPAEHTVQLSLQI